MTPSIKEIILGILTAVSGIGAFWLWSQGIPELATGEIKDFQIFIWAAVGLIFSASLFVLASVFIKEKKVIYPASIIAIGAPFLFVEATNEALVALLIAVLLIIYSVYRIQKEFSLSFGFGLSKLTKSGLPLYLTVASIVVSVFYMNVLDREKIITSLLPRPLFESTTNIALDPLRSFIGLPRVNEAETVDDLFTQLLKDQFASEKIDISQIPQAEFKKLITKQREELSKNFGIKIKGDEKPTDVFYAAIVSYAERLLSPYKRYLPYLAALAFFFAFKTFTFPVYYLSLLMSFILVKIMIGIKILKLEKTMVEVEKLTL